MECIQVSYFGLTLRYSFSEENFKKKVIKMWIYNEKKSTLKRLIKHRPMFYQHLFHYFKGLMKVH